MAFPQHGRGRPPAVEGATEPLPQPVTGDRVRRGRGNRLRWLLSREAVDQMALAVVMIAILWGSIALQLSQLRQETLQQATRDSSNLAHTAAESIGQTIAGVDDTLRFMVAVYGADPRHFDIDAWAARANRTRGVALEFAIIGPDGKLTASSLGAANGGTDFSEREFFKTHAGEGPDRLFISKPIFRRASGRWSILFTRGITAADGWFMGIMAASVDPSWLTQLHRKLDIGRGSVMLVGNDGLIRALSVGPNPGSGQGVGQDIRPSALFAAASQADQGTTAWVNPIDGTRQTVSFQHLPGYASIVAVALNTDDIFAPYRLHQRQYSVFGVCLTVLILIMGGFLLSGTRRLLISRRTLEDTMDTISQGIVMVDAKGRIPVINRRASEMMRLAGWTGSARRAPGNASGVPLGDARQDGQRPYDFLARHQTDSPVASSFEETLDDGKVLEIHTHPLADGGAVRTFTDITERKNAEARIIHLALHDALTGLPNRRLFADTLFAAINTAKAGGSACAVLSVDLDRFKYVNDLYGHRVGDRLLIGVADRLRSAVGAADTVARIGGDEFCILQAAIASPADTQALGQALVIRLSKPYEIEGHEICLSGSVGAALCPAHGGSSDQLLTNADTALYQAKAHARGRFELYDPAMDILIAERQSLELDLRSALALDQLSVYYQPIFNSVALDIVGFEALVRWHHPTRGSVSPDVFIAIAEESGLILNIGHWVMETALTEAARWPKSIQVSVNLSPKQFSVSDIAGRISIILADTGLAPDRLTLELTEGVLIDNSDRALSAIAALKALGIRFALDDFGTGYSSLSYLRRFPFDSIKIDKSFVMTVCEEAGARTIVQAILGLASNLGLMVVAEGVENSAQLEWLRAAGCPSVQGFLLGRPMPRDAINEFMEEAGIMALRGA